MVLLFVQVMCQLHCFSNENLKNWESTSLALSWLSWHAAFSLVKYIFCIYYKGGFVPGFLPNKCTFKIIGQGKLLFKTEYRFYLKNCWWWKITSAFYLNGCSGRIYFFFFSCYFYFLLLALLNDLNKKGIFFLSALCEGNITKSICSFIL